MTIEFVVNLENHKRRIWSICWSPDGNFLASVGADKYITIWIKKTNNKIKNANSNSKFMKKLKMFGDMKHKSGNIEFDVYDIIESNHEKSLRHIEFSRDGSFFVVASFDSKCSIYKKNKNEKWVFYKFLEGHEKEVKCASIHPTNKYIVTCGRDKSIWIHAKADEMSCGGEDGGQLKQNMTINDEHTGNTTNDEEQEKIDTNIDEANGNSGDKDSSQMDNKLDFNFDGYLTAHSEDIKYVAWCPLSENTFISLSYDNSLKLWNKQINEWNCIQTLNEHTSVVWCVAFNFDGSEFATCSDDKSIRIWKSEKKTWYNKHKYPFLYQQIVKDARKSSNDSSLTCLVNKSNDTLDVNATNDKNRYANDIHRNSNHNSRCNGKEKGINELNLMEKNKKNFEKSEEPKVHVAEEKISCANSSVRILDYSKEEKNAHTVIKSAIQNNFVPLYFDHGLFKFVYKYGDVLGENMEKGNENKREEQELGHQEKGNQNEEHFETQDGIKNASHNTSHNSTHNASLNASPNDEENGCKMSKMDVNELREGIQKGDDKSSRNNEDITKKNEENRVLIMNDGDKTDIQSTSKIIHDEQETNTPFAESSISSMSMIPFLSDKEKDFKNISFDDWKIKHVIEGYHKRSISYLDWNAYEDLLAVSSFDNSLKIFQKNINTWNLIDNIENAHLSDVNCVVWCPQKYQDYFLLATAGDDCVINIWKYTKN